MSHAKVSAYYPQYVVKAHEIFNIIFKKGKKIKNQSGLLSRDLSLRNYHKYASLSSIIKNTRRVPAKKRQSLATIARYREGCLIPTA